MFLIIVSVLAGIILATLSNWIYDILKSAGFFSDRPTTRNILIIFLLFLPFVLLVALPQIREDNQAAVPIFQNTPIPQAVSQVNPPTLSPTITPESTHTPTIRPTLSAPLQTQTAEVIFTQVAQQVNALTEATPRATVVRTNDFDGHWIGISSEGKAVLFEVKNGLIVNFMTTINGPENCDKVTLVLLRAGIIQEDGNFEDHHPNETNDDLSKGSYVIKGIFDSNSTMSGEVIYNYSPELSVCGTIRMDWSATRL